MDFDPQRDFLLIVIPTDLEFEDLTFVNDTIKSGDEILAQLTGLW